MPFHCVQPLCEMPLSAVCELRKPSRVCGDAEVNRQGALAVNQQGV